MATDRQGKYTEIFLQNEAYTIRFDGIQTVANGRLAAEPPAQDICQIIKFQFHSEHSHRHGYN